MSKNSFNPGYTIEIPSAKALVQPSASIVPSTTKVIIEKLEDRITPSAATPSAATPDYLPAQVSQLQSPQAQVISSTQETQIAYNLLDSNWSVLSRYPRILQTADNIAGIVNSAPALVRFEAALQTATGVLGNSAIYPSTQERLIGLFNAVPSGNNFESWNSSPTLELKRIGDADAINARRNLLANNGHAVLLSEIFEISSPGIRLKSSSRVTSPEFGTIELSTYGGSDIRSHENGFLGSDDEWAEVYVKFAEPVYVDSFALKREEGGKEAWLRVTLLDGKEHRIDFGDGTVQVGAVVKAITWDRQYAENIFQVSALFLTPISAQPEASPPSRSFANSPTNPAIQAPATDLTASTPGQDETLTKPPIVKAGSAPTTEAELNARILEWEAKSKIVNDGLTELQSLETEKFSLQTQQAAATTAVQTTEAERKAASDALALSQADLTALTGKIVSREKTIAGLESKLSSLMVNKTNLLSRKDTLEGNLNAIAIQKAILTKEIASLQALGKQYQVEINALTSRLQSQGLPPSERIQLTSDRNLARRRLDVNTVNLRASNSKLAKLNSQERLEKKELAAIPQRIISLDSQSASLTRQRESQSNALLPFLNERRLLEAKVGNLQNALARADEGLLNAKNLLGNIGRSLEELIQKIAVSNARLLEKQTELAAMPTPDQLRAAFAAERAKWAVPTFDLRSQPGFADAIPDWSAAQRSWLNSRPTSSVIQWASIPTSRTPTGFFTSADRQRLYFSEGPYIRETDIRSGETLRTLSVTDQSNILAMATSLTGSYVAVASEDQRLRIVDLSNSQVIQSIQLPANTQAMSWQPNETGLVVSTSQGIHQIHLNGTSSRLLASHSSASLSPDGKFLIASIDNRLEFVDAATLEVSHGIDFGWNKSGNWVMNSDQLVAVDPAGKFVAVSHGAPGFGSGYFHVYQISDGQSVDSIDSYGVRRTWIQFSGDGKLIAARNYQSGDIEFFDLSDGTWRQRTNGYSLGRDYRPLNLSADGTVLFVMGPSGIETRTTPRSQPAGGPASWGDGLSAKPIFENALAFATTVLATPPVVFEPLMPANSQTAGMKLLQEAGRLESVRSVLDDVAAYPLPSDLQATWDQLNASAAEQSKLHAESRERFQAFMNAQADTLLAGADLATLISKMPSALDALLSARPELNEKALRGELTVEDILGAGEIALSPTHALAISIVRGELNQIQASLTDFLNTRNAISLAPGDHSVDFAKTDDAIRLLWGKAIAASDHLEILRSATQLFTIALPNGDAISAVPSSLEAKSPIPQRSAAVGSIQTVRGEVAQSEITSGAGPVTFRAWQGTDQFSASIGTGQNITIRGAVSALDLSATPSFVLGVSGRIKLSEPTGLVSVFAYRGEKQISAVTIRDGEGFSVIDPAGLTSIVFVPSIKCDLSLSDLNVIHRPSLQPLPASPVNVATNWHVAFFSAQPVAWDNGGGWWWKNKVGNYGSGINSEFGYYHPINTNKYTLIQLSGDGYARFAGTPVSIHSVVTDPFPVSTPLPTNRYEKLGDTALLIYPGAPGVLWIPVNSWSKFTTSAILSDTRDGALPPAGVDSLAVGLGNRRAQGGDGWGDYPDLKSNQIENAVGGFSGLFAVNNNGISEMTIERVFVRSGQSGSLQDPVVHSYIGRSIKPGQNLALYINVPEGQTINNVRPRWTISFVIGGKEYVMTSGTYRYARSEEVRVAQQNPDGTYTLSWKTYTPGMAIVQDSKVDVGFVQWKQQEIAKGNIEVADPANFDAAYAQYQATPASKLPTAIVPASQLQGEARREFLSKLLTGGLRETFLSLLVARLQESGYSDADAKSLAQAKLDLAARNPLEVLTGLDLSSLDGNPAGVETVLREAAKLLVPDALSQAVVGDKIYLPNGDILSKMTRESLTRIQHDAQQGLNSFQERQKYDDSQQTRDRLAHFKDQLEAATGLLALIPAGENIPIVGSDPNAAKWVAYIEQTTTDPASLSEKDVKWFSLDPTDPAFSIESLIRNLPRSAFTEFAIQESSARIQTLLRSNSILTVDVIGSNVANESISSSALLTISELRSVFYLIIDGKTLRSSIATTKSISEKMAGELLADLPKGVIQGIAIDIALRRLYPEAADTSATFNFGVSMAGLATTVFLSQALNASLRFASGAGAIVVGVFSYPEVAGGAEERPFLVSFGNSSILAPWNVGESIRWSVAENNIAALEMAVEITKRWYQYLLTNDQLSAAGFDRFHTDLADFRLRVLRTIYSR